MQRFFAAGGFPMFVIAAISLGLLVLAVRFALTPSPRRLALIRALSWALVFTSISGSATDLMSVFSHVTRIPEFANDPLLPLLAGFGEALAPTVLGFSMLGIVWLITALGVRRAGDALDAAR